MSQFVTTEVRSGVATVSIDRPPVNAMNLALYGEIRDVFASFSSDQSVRAAILRSACDRAFLAGADIRERREMIAADASNQVFVDEGRRAIPREAFWAIYDCAVPVIASVNGAAMGAGLAVVACCDIIIVAESATFGMTEIEVGLLGGVKFLERLIGPVRARRAFLMAERMSARQLETYSGHSITVVPSGELEAESNRIAEAIASKSAVAVRLAKESFNRTAELSLKDGYRLEQDYTARLVQHPDSVASMESFLNHRSAGSKLKT